MTQPTSPTGGSPTGPNSTATGPNSTATGPNSTATGAGSAPTGADGGSPAVFPGGPALFRLDPAVAHLNHGSFGAVPIPVQEAQAALRDEAHADPDAFFVGAPDRIAAARARIAAHLGADPDGIAFVSNATEGANLALAAIPLADGDEVLVTDHGYGTVTAAAARRATVTTAVLDPYLPDEDAVREAVLAAVTPRTKAALLDHVSSPTARPIATPRLLAELADRGITTVVDGAHAPGMLADPLAVGADFYFGNLHKWGYAPSGTAVLAVAPAHRGRVRALVPSWEDAHGFPRSVENRATADYTGWLAAPEGLDLLARLDAAKVRAHNSALAAHGAALLAELPGLTPLPWGEGIAMRSLRLPPGLAETPEAARVLRERMAAEHGIRILVWPWAGGGGIRVCGQLYNRPEEYERLAAVLPGFLSGA
ncbi:MULTISPECIES: aminotransferase class V-fold PLP-dependent enzyme [Streptomyces]|uniref:aminotransferase class V-fold PLP-dependent enzyme n=1 Tax=Streptomyces TaxID=1883 RepID=UPI001677698F|nr:MULTISPECIES: aminotransferase class V-fold PLP-dependent enzyme [Streptomyces]MBD3578843.1 aminotransferase class V-fold PLP-dependent enzyme [Streptomyces sp. KD18]GGS80214.1 isopenicillin-N epimerase [Streptomyces toxytricini]